MTGIERTAFEPPADWGSAYDNRAAVGLPAVEAFAADLTARAAAFREELAATGRAELDLAYGDRPRQRFDRFTPEGKSKGLAVFVHGGYWRSFDNSFWSHLAAGPLAHGYAVAIPSYTLCPEVRISDITVEIAAFLTHAAAGLDQPIRLAGHSAGGHLVARMVSGALPAGLAGRIEKVVSISGVHDLRPLLRTPMNGDLGLDLAEARAESPALLEPIDDVDLICWAGADELPSFRHQNRQLALNWSLLGARAEAVEAKDKNHFNVILDLSDPDSALTKALAG